MDNLNQLRSFLTVYRVGSITRAAEALHLTQPAVTRQLRQLEERMSRQLFTRVPRGIVPTAAAHELARRIGTHLDALDLLAESLKLGSQSLAGTVYVGGPAEFLGAKVLPSLSDLHEENILLRIRLGAPEVLVQDLQAGALDLVVSTVRISNPELESRTLYLEELVLVGSASWAEKIPRKTLVAAEVLKQIPLLSYAEDLPLLRRYWRQVFGSLPSATASLVVPDLRALVEVAASGGGVTVLPRYLVEDLLVQGDLMELLHPLKPPVNQLHLVWKRDTSLHPRVIYVKERLERASERW
ncbi:LysR family transcriptional regulator [Deinococcus roseus]|uniref:LysR family transcriptional regulator n=1 Tax=Deinococcus roseus TaxID=392414 RepID=A0ABQ2D8J3_9DEIO|nr:LysR family transcriptional regulator [Deinococcus roseus]GGJ49599.1 LysR family transcriptional regulator [Deinococcus roseus]